MSKLREARDLIADPAHWTTGAFARNGSGEDVHPRADEARQWCAAGALGAVFADQKERDALERSAEALFPQYGDEPVVYGSTFPGVSEDGNCTHIVGVNDSLGHGAVMQIYEKAIVEVEGGL